jgi:hypothetical protein
MPRQKGALFIGQGEPWSQSCLVKKELEGCLENIPLLFSGEETRGLP